MIAMDKLLQKCKCFPSQVGKEWAQKFWKNQEKVVECIEQCQASQKIGQRKGKGAICAVLDACLSCAQQEAKEIPVLKSSLAFERETGKTLGIRNDHLKQLLERFSHLLNRIQPSAPVKQVHRLMHSADPESWNGDFWFDSDDDVKEIADSEPQSISLRPLVKTETTVDDDDEICTTVQTIPWSPAELVKIQEKFSRRSGESEVEYVWREEAGGFWGPGERGEPLEIRATSYSDLAVAVQKAACIQAIYERDEFRKSPMLAPIDPVRLTPLIRGLPDCLKMFVANTQDHILAARRDDDRGCRQNPNSPIPTWSEFVQDIDKYGRRMGWISSSSIKSQDHPQQVRKIHSQNPRYPNFKERFKFNKERGELWHKALALGAPRPFLHGASMEDLRTLMEPCGVSQHIKGIQAQ
uniref:Uncharacterized protein n=1 Tax=Anser cygnoides TaxID=8845 RepID=A0A8B9DS55_ANSCY